MGKDRDYDALEAVVLEYIEFFGMSKKAREYFLVDHAEEEDIARAEPERAQDAE